MTEGRRRRRFFLVIASILAAVVAAGFGITFFAPLARGTFSAAPIYYVHGALFFAWIALFVVQTVWIQTDRVAWHRATGWCAAALVVPMAISLVGVGIATSYRDLDRGFGEIAISQCLGTCTAALIFVALVAAGIAQRRRPAIHRRLLLLATISITWPAFQRLRHYGSVPHYEITLGLIAANLPILAAVIYDKVTTGRIHRIWWLGALLVAEQATELALFDTAPWRAGAHAVFGLFG